MPQDPPANRKQDRPSKTQRKREMLELQALGESLIDLGDNDLATLPIPAELLDAIRAARKMHKHGALHRQRQYIGKLMRKIDAEPIRAALAQIQMRARANAARFHTVENWRDRLLHEGDAALTQLVKKYPAADRQHLRRLIRDAIAEKQHAKPPKSARQLFRYINELLQ